MKIILAAIAVAFSLCACSTPTPTPAPTPDLIQPQVSEPTPIPEIAPVSSPEPAPAKSKTKKKKAKNEVRKDVRQTTHGEKPDCGLVRWAASTLSKEDIKRLERSASAEQKRHAKACLSQ